MSPSFLWSCEKLDSVECKSRLSNGSW